MRGQSCYYLNISSRTVPWSIIECDCRDSVCYWVHLRDVSSTTHVKSLGVEFYLSLIWKYVSTHCIKTRGVVFVIKVKFLEELCLAGWGKVAPT